jgi:undecaprenyl-diphosphatase
MAGSSTARALWTSGVLLVGFVLICCWVSSAAGLPGDERVLEEIHQAAGTRFDVPMQAVADLSNLWPLAVVAVVIAGALLWRRRWVHAIALVGAVVVVWVVNPVLKALIARQRPTVRPDAPEVSEYSFPSGHAANTAALGFALVVISWESRWRIPMLVTCTVIVALVGVSQLVLGVHYPSDILAGWLWAAGSVLLASCVVAVLHEGQRAKVEDR